MIAGLLRDADEDRRTFLALDQAGLVGPEGIDAYIERQENRITLIYSAIATAKMLAFVGDVRGTIDRL